MRERGTDIDLVIGRMQFWEVSTISWGDLSREDLLFVPELYMSSSITIGRLQYHETIC